MGIFTENFVTSILYLSGIVVLINLIVLIFRSYIKNLFEKARIKFDDHVVSEVMKPIYYLSLILILYSFINQFELFGGYKKVFENLTGSIVILFLATFLARIAEVLINFWLKVKKKTEQPPKLISGTISGAICVVAGLLILNTWGVEITPLLAALGVGGIALGLGLQETLTNLFAGLHIVSDEPITNRDYIVLKDGTEGFVEDISWRSTRLKTIQNNVVIIPNSVLAQSIIENKTAEGLDISVIINGGVAYGSDLDKAERVILDEVKAYQKKTEYLDSEFEHLIRFNEFGESNIKFNLIIRLKRYDDRFVVRHEMIKNIKKRFDAEKIEIS